MRILTALAKPGLVLSQPLYSQGGILFGQGTRLTRRYLRVIHEENIRILDVEDDPSIELWERAPDVDTFVRQLDARFEGYEKHRQMNLIKAAVRDVYLDFLFELESSS